METLASFINFLGNYHLINKCFTTETLDFETRLKLQKYTYLAGKLGLKHECGYSLYLYGPYAPLLADAYYELANNPAMLQAAPQQPVGLDQDRFLKLVDNKDTSWLEVAATLVDQAPRFWDDEDLVRHVESIKYNYSIDYIRNVLSDLREHGMITSVHPQS